MSIHGVKLAKSATGKLSALNIDPMRALEEMAKAYWEYHIVREQEVTKRRQIEADEKATLAEIALRRDVMLEYLRRSFDERASNFEAMFERMDQALAGGDVQALAVLSNALLELAKASPFRDLASVETTRKALRDPDHNWEV